MKRNFNNTVVIWLAFSLMPAICNAFQLSPMSVEMTPTGMRAMSTFIIDNNGAHAIPVEISIFSRSISESGSDILIESDDDFIVYPVQLILMPGKSKSVRLQWIGPQYLDKERAYRMVVKQLPLNLEKAAVDGAQISMLFSYVASVYVTPKQHSNAALKITSASIENNKLIIVIHNSGNVHAILREPVITLSTTANNVVLESEQLPGLVGANILTDHTRIFSLPIPVGIKDESFNATLQYQKQK